ncbi:MAG: DUF1847 domain-containing protein [Thermodesulfobacteriota bacterium]|nr:DUF1847 domain-containing protein [Thermodesulfobacteriota bacterium]
MKCAQCKIIEKICRSPEGRGPNECPTKTQSALFEKVLSEYQKPEIKEFARVASVQEGECYIKKEEEPYARHPIKPRLQELIEFSKKLGYKKLGIAFCSGVFHEAALLTEILERHGFTVVSAVCKAGRIPKEEIGVKEDEKVRPGRFESMCNPIGQAMLLNKAVTDLNVMIGLCVGHDALFLKYVKAPTTVFAVKDRVTGHNPFVSLYTLHSYSERFMKRDHEVWKV